MIIFSEYVALQIDKNSLDVFLFSIVCSLMMTSSLLAQQTALCDYGTIKVWVMSTDLRIYTIGPFPSCVKVAENSF